MTKLRAKLLPFDSHSIKPDFEGCEGVQVRVSENLVRVLWIFNQDWIIGHVCGCTIKLLGRFTLEPLKMILRRQNTRANIVILDKVP